MNNIFKGVLLTIAFTTVLGQEPPIVGGFSEAEISDEVSGVAEEVLDQLASHFGAEDGCSLKLENITDVKTQVVAGTNYLFSLEISSDGESCENEVKICSDVKVYKPLPFACSSRIDTCLSLVESEKILCIPQQMRILHCSCIICLIHPQHVLFIYEKLSKQVNRLWMVQIINWKFKWKQMELILNVNMFKKQCSNIIVHEPLAHCPHDEEDCILPVDLQEVECVHTHNTHKYFAPDQELLLGGPTSQVSLNNAMEEILKRIHDIKNVTGVIVVNSEGIPIKTTLDNSMTVQYSGLLSQFAERSKCVVRDLDPTNELTYLRIRSKRYEILVAPDKEYILIALQNPPDPIN
ncbi:DYNLRB [Lepeophtheirus salmonis]|uniref:DYNLRB n=1 Tax=Lepeophtheirus salmonis TaxID=72036 RepID=A0A7R8CUR7_LEPSM|nr:DYNLRB [Lepeophtheirus salmonis]CAF2938844.1 DYNLRB [Lepeophtheirus salmonis]